MKNIDFYFDLGSPYSYMGFNRIKQISALYNVQITYKPMLLGGVFKATGNNSPNTVPAKARYSMIDLHRWSKLWSIPVEMNPYFPINTLVLMKFITAVQLFKPEQFDQILSGLFESMFLYPLNLNDPAILMSRIKEFGLDPNQVENWLNGEKVKSQLRFVTEQAIDLGIFGAPSFIVDEELYWGIDHLHFVENAIKNDDN